MFEWPNRPLGYMSPHHWCQHSPQLLPPLKDFVSLSNQDLMSTVFAPNRQGIMWSSHPSVPPLYIPDNRLTHYKSPQFSSYIGVSLVQLDMGLKGAPSATLLPLSRKLFSSFSQWKACVFANKCILQSPLRSNYTTLFS